MFPISVTSSSKLPAAQAKNLDVSHRLLNPTANPVGPNSCKHTFTTRSLLHTSTVMHLVESTVQPPSCFYAFIRQSVPDMKAAVSQSTELLCTKCPLAFHFTQRKSWSPHSGQWAPGDTPHPLSPQPCPSLLRPLCLSHAGRTLLPQGLCSGCSLCLEYSFPRYSHRLCLPSSHYLNVTLLDRLFSWLPDHHTLSPLLCYVDLTSTHTT